MPATIEKNSGLDVCGDFKSQSSIMSHDAGVYAGIGTPTSAGISQTDYNPWAIPSVRLKPEEDSSDPVRLLLSSPVGAFADPKTEFDSAMTMVLRKPRRSTLECASLELSSL